MSINIGPPSVDGLKPKIAVIGVGGAGGNAIANMIAAQVEGVDFIVANTDAQALNTSPAEHRIQLGPQVTEGLGAGSRAEVGRAAAEETLEQIEEALQGAHMCFIAAGMGGGTGTGAAPVIAKAARDKNILTVGVVTKPFMFEGSRRMRSAESGIEELQEHVDTLIVIPNQNLFLVANPNTTFKEAFEMADNVLQQGVRGITDLMVMPGLVNLDFADVRSVMHEMGKAMMGTGEAEGDDRALAAAEAAIANPLLDGVSMQGAKGVIISITGGEDMRLMEVDQAASHIRELVDPDANIIWGSAFNPDLEGKVRVSVVATGIDADQAAAEGRRMESARPFNFARSEKPAASSAPAAPAFESAPEDEQTRSGEDDSSWNAPAEEESSDNEALPGFSGFASSPQEEPGEEGGEDAMPGSLADGPSRYSDEAEQDEDEEEEGETPAAPSPGPVFATDPSPASAPDLEANTREPSASPPSEPAEPAEDESDEDLLDLGTAEMLPPEEAKPAQPAPAKPASSGKHPLRSDADRAAPRLQTGGPTLFERMANLSRGGSRAESEDEEEEDSSVDVPRFLNRQNNK